MSLASPALAQGPPADQSGPFEQEIISLHEEALAQTNYWDRYGEISETFRSRWQQWLDDLEPSRDQSLALLTLARIWDSRDKNQGQPPLDPEWDSYLERASSHFEEVGFEEGWALTRYYLTQNLIELDRLDEAIEVAQEAFEYQSPVQGWLGLSLAELFRNSGEWLKWNEWMLEAKSLIDQAYEPDIFEFYLLGAEFHYATDLGLFDVAEVRLDQLKQIAEQRGHPDLLLAISFYEPLFATACGEDSRALSLVEDAFEPPLSYHSQFAFVRGVLELGRSLRQPEYEPRARASFQFIIDSWPGSFDARRANHRIAFLDIRAGDHEAAQVRLTGAGSSEELQDIEGLFVRSLSCRLTMEKASTESDLDLVLPQVLQTYQSLLEEWDQAASLTELGWLAFNERCFILELLTRVRSRMSGEKGLPALVSDLARAHSLGAIAETLGQESVDLAWIQNQVPHRGGALILIPGWEESGILLIGKDSIDLVWTLGISSWEAVRQPAAVSVMAGEKSGKELEELSEVVFPPEIRSLVESWESLIFVGFESQGWIPIECLAWDQTTSVGERFAVSFWPSLSVAKGLEIRRQGREKSTSQDSWVLASPQITSGKLTSVGSVDLRPDEISSLESSLDPRAVIFKLGEEASFEAFSEAAKTRPRYSLVVTHGIFDVFRSKFSGLALSPGAGSDDEGEVWADQVEALDFVSPVVSLAVCGASRGPSRFGDDGRSNLMGAFLVAGADVVFASQANLLFEPTIELMTTLSAHFAQGDSPAKALQKARKDYRAAHPQAPLREYGLLRTYGLGSEAVFTSTTPMANSHRFPRSVFWGIAGAVLALVFGVLYVRRRAS